MKLCFVIFFVNRKFKTFDFTPMDEPAIEQSGNRSEVRVRGEFARRCKLIVNDCVYHLK